MSNFPILFQKYLDTIQIIMDSKTYGEIPEVIKQILYLDNSIFQNQQFDFAFYSKCIKRCIELQYDPRYQFSILFMTLTIVFSEFEAQALTNQAAILFAITYEQISAYQAIWILFNKSIVKLPNDRYINNLMSFVIPESLHFIIIRELLTQKMNNAALDYLTFHKPIVCNIEQFKVKLDVYKANSLQDLIKREFQNYDLTKEEKEELAQYIH